MLGQSINSVRKRVVEIVSRHPILWLLYFILWPFLSDRIFAWANRRIDERAGGMSAQLVRFILWFNTPLTLFGSVAVLTICGILMHAYFTARSKEANSKIFPPTVTQSPATSNLVQAVQLYLNRDQKNERFRILMKNASAVWVATHQATTLRGEREWWNKIERLIILAKDGFSANLLGTVTHETTFETIKNDIVSALTDAIKTKIETKELDAFFNSIVIGNPNSTDSWFAIEVYIPWAPARLRPSIVITHQQNADALKNITMFFEAMWKQQPSPNPDAARLNLYEREMKRLKEISDKQAGEIEQLQAKKKELENIKNEFLSFKQQHGRWWVMQCGKDTHSLNLSVAIQFIDHHDADLATQIYALFSSDFPRSPWKTSLVENRQWLDTPSSKSRSCLF